MRLVGVKHNLIEAVNRLILWPHYLINCLLGAFELAPLSIEGSPSTMKLWIHSSRTINCGESKLTLHQETYKLNELRCLVTFIEKKSELEFLRWSSTVEQKFHVSHTSWWVLEFNITVSLMFTNNVIPVFAYSFKGGRGYIRLPNELKQHGVKSSPFTI